MHIPTRREQLLKRDGNQCWLCHREMHFTTVAQRRTYNLNLPHEATIDHIIPKIWGGRNAIKNLRLAHRRCNNMRAALFPHTLTKEFLRGFIEETGLHSMCVLPGGMSIDEFFAQFELVEGKWIRVIDKDETPPTYGRWARRHALDKVFFTKDGVTYASSWIPGSKIGQGVRSASTEVEIPASDVG